MNWHQLISISWQSDAKPARSGSQHSVKRTILWTVLLLVLAAWMGFGVLFSAVSGWTVGGFWTGVLHAPAFAAGWLEGFVRPGRVFAGLGDPKAVAVLRESFGEGVRPADGRLLYELIVAQKCRRILDVGTAKGYSALWFALAAERNGGQVTTVEIDPNLASVARGNFERAGLGRCVVSYTNDALVQIPLIEGDFDFVFLDIGLPGINKKLLELVRGKLAPGAIIAAHNGCAFAVTQPEYLSAIKADSDLSTRLVVTPSGGISISQKRR